MTETVSVTYKNCSFCVGKSHCGDCSRELAEALREKPGIADAQVSTREKAATVDHSLDRDDLEDILESLGLLVD